MRPSRSSAARAQSARSSTGRHSGAGTPRANEIVAIARQTRRKGRSTTKRAPVGWPALVAEVAAVRARVRARDREAEPGAGDAVARDAGAREPLEQRLLDLVRDARARVLDRDPHAAVLDDVARARGPAPGRSGTRS